MPLRGRAHGGRRVPRRRVPDRVGLRDGDAAGPARPLPPARLHHPVHRRRDRDADPDGASATRSPAGSTTTSRTKFAAIELVPKTNERRARDAVRPPELRRDQGRGRHPDPGPRVDALGPERPARARWSRAATRSRRTSEPTVAAGERRAPRVGRHGRRSARCCSCSSRLVRRVLALPTRHPEDQVVPAHRRRRRRAVGDHDGGRVGGHRGRPTTVDRLQLHEGRGRRDRQHRRVDHVPRRRRALRRSSGSRRSWCCAA